MARVGSDTEFQTVSPVRLLCLSCAVGFVLATLGGGRVDGEERRVSVDLFRGPVISSSRVIGMGGAYVGVAEGVQGMGANCASMGNRFPYSTTWFDWDLTLDWVNLAPGDSVDMDNDGHGGGDESYMALSAGLSFLFGRLAVGLWVGGDTITLETPTERIGYDFTRSALGLTYALWDEQLIVGAALTGASVAVSLEKNVAAVGDDPDWQGEAGGSWGNPGGQLALLWRPQDQPFRVGIDALLPVAVETSMAPSQTYLEGAVPDQIHLPWRLGIGFSWYHSLAGHHFNRPRHPPEKAPRERGAQGSLSPRSSVDRRYLLLATDLIVHGPAGDGAVAPGTFAVGATRPSGETVSFSIRAGMESEVWNNRLILRGGSYLEPPRVTGAAARVHGTAGLEIRLFRVWLWQLRLGASADVAKNYLNWGVGLGFWH
jgi:hypothetical protein